MQFYDKKNIKPTQLLRMNHSRQLSFNQTNIIQNKIRLRLPHVSKSDDILWSHRQVREGIA